MTTLEVLSFPDLSDKEAAGIALDTIIRDSLANSAHRETGVGAHDPEIWEASIDGRLTPDQIEHLITTAPPMVIESIGFVGLSDIRALANPDQ